MAETDVLYDVSERIATITLNRPEARNALSSEVLRQLPERMTQAEADPDVDVLILTGTDPAFCAGLDLKELGTTGGILGGGRAEAESARRGGPIPSMQVPLIGAINGAAIGGGLCLALALDVRLAAPGAYFRAAGINNGLTASELGLSYLLPRAIGSSRAAEIMLTGRDVDAVEAERIGLVSSIVPEDELLERCYDMADRIQAFSRPGIELTKRTLWTGLDAGSLEQHMYQEGMGQLFVRMMTDNFEEATRARKEKRPAVFRDTR